MSTLFEPTVKPLNKVFLTTSLTKPFSASATILKRKGANGSPYLSPRYGENSGEGLPLINMEMDADFKHPSIH